MNNHCTIEILVTEDCNNHCKYCIQTGMHKKIYLSTEKLNDIFKFINNFKKEHAEINDIDLMLFGGEPLLNESVCNILFDVALENKYNIVLITNGLLIDKYIDKLVILDRNNLLKSLQISYDGNPIHDLYRCNTSKKVLDSIKLCRDNNIKNLCIKSTLPLDGFQYMYDCYIDCVENLNLDYVPTIDYTYSNLINEDDIDNYIEIFKQQLLKIAKHGIRNRVKIPRTDLLALNGKAICSAGCYYFAINSDLDVSRCHQTSFSTEEYNKIHVIGNINDSDINTKINEMFKIHSLVDRNLTGNSECEKCDVTLCKKCCANNYNYSKEINYIDKWYDKNTDNLCKMYKMITKISKAYNYKIQNL